MLTDKKSVRVRNSACGALGRAFLYSRNPTVINELEKVAENDSDGQVRKTALESISLINKDREILEKLSLVKDEKQFIEEKLQFMETRITQI